jgi:nitrate reductase assembly molybdenum cofactor insertion protein NarJ
VKVLAVWPQQVPALTAALAHERDFFFSMAAVPEQLEEDRDEAIRSVQLAAGWLYDMPRLELADEETEGYLAGVLEFHAQTALAEHRFAEAADLIAIRAALDEHASALD